MDYRGKILDMVRSAPVLPSAVAKHLGTTSIMSGAMLSEMRSKGLLKVSHLKVGGSPVYYSVPEHLMNYIEGLNDKDRKAVKLLKEKSILRDSELEPLTRVCLQNSRDFAHPLKVVYDNKEELFWKWYLLPDKEAEGLIRDIISPKKKAPKIENEIGKVEEKREVKKESVEEKKEVGNPKSAFEGKHNSVESFFHDNNIKIVDRVVNRKNDVDFVVSLPSAFGPLTHYCKFKDKKRISDSDLSSALVQGQLKKLPVLFLYTGELSKGAKELIPQLKGFVAKRL